MRGTRKTAWKPPAKSSDSEREFDDPSEETLNEYSSKMETFSRMGNIAQTYGDDVRTSFLIFLAQNLFRVLLVSLD